MFPIPFCIGVALIGYTVCDLLKTKDNKVCSPSELAEFMGDGIRLSKSIRITEKLSNDHILCVEPCGQGKSTRFIAPNIAELEKSDCTIIVTDPSGELEKMVKTNKKKYIFNPFRKDTIGCDFLQNCQNEFEVEKIAKIIMTNGNDAARKGVVTDHQNWIQMAIPLLSSYLLYSYYSRRHSFNQSIENICIKSMDYIYHEIMGDEYSSPKRKLKSFLQVSGSPQTLSSIRNSLNTSLQVFLDSNVRRMFNKESLDLSRLRQEPSIVFIQIPETHADYFATISATFMSQLFDSFLANEGLQVYMLFDEFCNIGCLGTDMPRLLSTVRKHNISIVAAIQSISQLFRTYGEIEGKELRELFKTIMCSASLKESAEYVSNLLGTKSVYQDKTHKTESLMSPDEIRRMDNDELLIICNNKRPVRDRMIQPIWA